MLDEHKIARIESCKLRRSYPRPVPQNAKGGHHGQHTDVPIRVVTTDRGAQGWGISSGPEELAQPLVGRNLADLFNPGTGSALAARVIDFPLWDLAGKILHLPVWQLLGAHGPRTVPVYAGGIYFDDIPAPDEATGLKQLLAACEQDARAGNLHFKLKIGRGAKVMDRAAGDQRDLAVLRHVRRHFPTAKLLVDANDGYTAEGAARFIAQAADLGLYWVEELTVENEHALTLQRDALRKYSPHTLIADGESRNGPTLNPPGEFGKWPADQLDELYHLAQRKLIDVLLMDIQACSFSAWRAIHPKIVASGAQGSPHAWAEPLKTYCAAQIAAGLGHVPILEGVPGVTEHVDAGGYLWQNGAITVPDAPGFGLDLDLSAVVPGPGH